jgi:K+-transporting ATPase ATPase C chain
LITVPAPLQRALRLTLLLWLLTALALTLPLLGLAGLVAPEAAAGSLVRRGGAVVGSRLLGQSFHSPRHLWGRPSGDPHLAATSAALPQQVAATASAWRAAGLGRPSPDLLLASASGVDPHIRLAAARQQWPRLAREHGLSLDQLEALARRHLEGPGDLRAVEPLVNVLGFNLALEAPRTSPPRP